MLFIITVRNLFNWISVFRIRNSLKKNLDWTTKIDKKSSTMAKRIKASKQKKEAEAEENKISINNIYESREADEVVSVNNQLEQETSNESMDEAEMIEAYHLEEKGFESSTETALLNTKNETPEETTAKEVDPMELNQQLAEENAKKQGLNLPAPQQKRDPKKDKDPIEGEDLGLQENDFLLSRKVNQSDLEMHASVNEEALLGSNERKPKDFLNVFRRGPSTKEQPKVDTTAAIENNAIVQKEVAAKQLLRNYHSKDNTEKNNALNIFKELKLTEEMIQEIKEDRGAHKNQNLIETIRELL